MDSRFAIKLAWEIITPLGWFVDPLVNCSSAISEGEGATSASQSSECVAFVGPLSECQVGPSGASVASFGSLAAAGDHRSGLAASSVADVDRIAEGWQFSATESRRGIARPARG